MSLSDLSRLSPVKPDPSEPRLSVVAGHEADNEDTDAAQDLQSAIYDQMPLKGPAWKREAIETNALLANLLPGVGDKTIGLVGGSLGNQTPLQRLAEKLQEEKSEDVFDILMDMFEDEQKRQQEERAQEWDRSMHEFAGQKLSGAEWKQMADWFDDPNNEEAWENAVMAQTGQTREEVKKTGAKIKRMYELQELERLGKISEQQKLELKEISNDKEVIRDISTQRSLMPVSENNLSGESLKKVNSVDSVLVANTAKRELIFTDTELQLIQKDLSVQNGIKKQNELSDNENYKGVSVAKSGINAEPLTANFNPVAQGMASQVISPDQLIKPVAALNSNLDMG